MDNLILTANLLRKRELTRLSSYLEEYQKYHFNLESICEELVKCRGDRNCNQEVLDQIIDNIIEKLELSVEVVINFLSSSPIGFFSIQQYLKFLDQLWQAGEVYHYKKYLLILTRYTQKHNNQESLKMLCEFNEDKIKLIEVSVAQIKLLICQNEGTKVINSLMTLINERHQVNKETSEILRYCRDLLSEIDISLTNKIVTFLIDELTNAHTYTCREIKKLLVIGYFNQEILLKTLKVIGNTKLKKDLIRHMNISYESLEKKEPRLLSTLTPKGKVLKKQDEVENEITNYDIEPDHSFNIPKIVFAKDRDDLSLKKIIMENMQGEGLNDKDLAVMAIMFDNFSLCEEIYKKSQTKEVLYIYLTSLLRQGKYLELISLVDEKKAKHEITVDDLSFIKLKYQAQDLYYQIKKGKLAKYE